MQNGQPSCFGKLWDPDNTECRGGNDPSYTHPKTGSSRRDICRWYSSCAAHTNQSKVGQAPKNIPISPPPQPPQPYYAPVYNPIRPPVNNPQALIPTAALIPQPAPQQTTQLVPTQQQQVAYVGNMPYTQPQFAQQPIMVPVNQPMPGVHVASFLTVPEPNNPDFPMGVRLWRTVYRSMFKAAFIGAANFIDYNPLTPAR